MKKLLIALFLFASSGMVAAAQDFKENEVGFVFSATNFPGQTEAGVGGRFLYNFTSIAGFEFTGTFYPVDRSVNYYHGTFNFKGTYRMEQRYKVNFFGFIGPGFFVADPNPGKADFNGALTAGGGVEGVLRPNVVGRADFADLVIFSRGAHTNNFDFKLSLMYRW
ncbi:MAG TPA: hypothetical protein VGL91_11560 [Acidobacteriota bacterium]|jgi:hypothetical protein